MPAECETNPGNTERVIELMRYPGLRVEARVIGPRVVGVEARGIFSKMMRPWVELMEEYVVREKPAVVGDDFVVTSLFFPPIPSPEFSRALKNQIKVRLSRRPVPQIMSISVTDRCGVDCWLCGHWGRELSPELTAGEIKSLVDTATSMGCFNVIWTGGDPLLRKDLQELTAYTRERGAINTMFTPGIHLDRQARGLARSGLYSVYVHLHSRNAREHDRLVGHSGAHEKVVKGVMACLDAGIYVGAETYMTHERLRDGTLEDIIEYAESIGCPEILLSDPLPTGKVLRREDLLLTPDDREILVRTQKEHNMERSGGIKIFTNSCVKGPMGVGCIAGNMWVHITAVGEVCACDYTPFSFGNVRNEPLKKIWRRIIRHPTYRAHTDLCRLQDPEFRRRYFDTIPEGAVLPYPIEKIEELRDKPAR